MEIELKPLSRMDLAKYPFTLEASEYVSAHGGLSLFELEQLPHLLEAAAVRIETALQGAVSVDSPDEDITMLSFPAAILLLGIIRNDVISQKYAWGEAKSVEQLVVKEPSWKLITVARSTMSWGVEAKPVSIGDCSYEYQMEFPSYLKAIPRTVTESTFKLVNRTLTGGKVLLTKAEMASLIAQGVKKRILGKLRDLGSQPQQVPQPIQTRAEKLRRRLIRSKVMQRQPEAFPRGVMWLAAPPCMRELRRAIVDGKEISPVAEFAFGSFLLELGSSKSEAEKFLSNFATDRSESLGLIARGRYTVPSCETLKRHGVCYRPDSLCRKIDRPSVYYKRRMEARSKSPAPRQRRYPLP